MKEGKPNLFFSQFRFFFGSVIQFRLKLFLGQMGFDWHRQCLKCEECNKVLNPGQHAEVREYFDS